MALSQQGSVESVIRSLYLWRLSSPSGMTPACLRISDKKAPHSFLQNLPEDFTRKQRGEILLDRQPPSWQESLTVGPASGRVTLPSKCWQEVAGHQHLDQPCNAKHSASLPSTAEEMHCLACGPRSKEYLAFKVLHHWKI